MSCRLRAAARRAHDSNRPDRHRCLWPQRAGLLARRHEVTVFKRDLRPGGYIRSLELDGTDVRVDTGVIVYNDPNFTRRLEDLLTDEGMVLILATTTEDQCYERYRHAVDFIKRFVLAYCEGGLLERTIGDVQILFKKPPGSRWPAPLVVGVKRGLHP